jgi:hypothetical protein
MIPEGAATPRPDALSLAPFFPAVAHQVNTPTDYGIDHLFGGEIISVPTHQHRHHHHHQADAQMMHSISNNNATTRQDAIGEVWQYYGAGVAHMMFDEAALGGSVSSALAYHEINHLVDGNVASPRQANDVDFETRVVPIPTDVLFGVLDYPGTNDWRASLSRLFLIHQVWSTNVYHEMRRELADRRYLIYRNLRWYLATEGEIRCKSSQRFRDIKKEARRRRQAQLRGEG